MSDNSPAENLEANNLSGQTNLAAPIGSPIGSIDYNQIWKDIFSDPEWLFKTGMGGIFNAICLVLMGASPLFFPLVFIVVALLSGYLLSAIRARLTSQEPGLPLWTDWPLLFVSGLTWIVIELLLNIFPALILGLVGLIWLSLRTMTTDSPEFIWVFVISALILQFAWLLLSFARPFLMVNFALKEKLTAGLDLPLVFSVITRAPATFIVAWLVILGLGMAAVAIPIITLIGVFFLPTTVFLANLASALIAAEAWRLANND